MTSELQCRINDCYVEYCEVIKPLIAQIEAQSEKFPLPIGWIASVLISAVVSAYFSCELFAHLFQE
jgi:hypothetical protein